MDDKKEVKVLTAKKAEQEVLERMREMPPSEIKQMTVEQVRELTFNDVSAMKPETFEALKVRISDERITATLKRLKAEGKKKYVLKGDTLEVFKSCRSIGELVVFWNTAALWMKYEPKTVEADPEGGEGCFYAKPR